MIVGLLKELAVRTGQYVRFHTVRRFRHAAAPDVHFGQAPARGKEIHLNPGSDALGGINLDLGCGSQKRPGFLGVDRRPFPGVDGITDLTQKHWLFDRPQLGSVKLVAATTADGRTRFMLPDNSVAEAYSSHFLEHLDHNQAKPERVRFMNELWRVLVPGGKATITTPHWASNRAYGDFTHADKPVSEMFYSYLSKAWRKENAPDNDIEFNPDGYSCDFDFQLTYSLHPALAEKGVDEVKFAVSWYKDAAPDLIALITAVK